MSNERLKKYRKNKQLYLKEISNILGISQSYYEKIEYGKRPASREFINKMLTAFPEDKEEILKLFF